MTQQSFTNLLKSLDLRWHQVWHQFVSMSTVDTSFKHCMLLFDFSNCQREQDEMVTFAGILEPPSWLQNLPMVCKGSRIDRNSRVNLRCHEVWHRSLCRLAIHHHTTPGQRKTPPSANLKHYFWVTFHWQAYFETQFRSIPSQIYQKDFPIWHRVQQDWNSILVVGW